MTISVKNYSFTFPDGSRNQDTYDPTAGKNKINLRENVTVMIGMDRGRQPIVV